MIQTEGINFVDNGEEVCMQGKIIKVVEACKWMHNGYWYCATHGVTFVTSYEKYAHLSTGGHRVGWLCWEHGLEKP